MALNTVDMPSLVIQSGASASNSIFLMDDAYGVGIQAPATLTASGVSVQVSASSGTTTPVVILQSGGIDITLAAGRALIMTPFPWRQLKLVSSSVEGQTDTFLVTKVFLV